MVAKQRLNPIYVKPNHDIKTFYPSVDHCLSTSLVNPRVHVTPHKLHLKNWPLESNSLTNKEGGIFPLMAIRILDEFTQRRKQTQLKYFFVLC